MKFLVNIIIEGKLLTISAESSILDLLDWGSEHASGISKVKCNLKINFSFYARKEMKESKYCKKGALFYEKWSG